MKRMRPKIILIIEKDEDVRQRLVNYCLKKLGRIGVKLYRARSISDAQNRTAYAIARVYSIRNFSEAEKEELNAWLANRQNQVDIITVPIELLAKTV
jgi:hypothetical protein